MKPLIYCIFALTMTAAAPALAHDPVPTPHIHAAEAVTHGTLVLNNAFARATLPNAPVAGGYVSIANTGEIDDRLVSASSPLAGEVQIHEMAVTNDVMSMRELPDGLAIPAGETVVLQPGGLHLMFMQLREPFVEGETVPVSLVFERAGSVDIELAIVAAGARSTSHGDLGGHGAHDTHGDAGTDHQDTASDSVHVAVFSLVAGDR